ncbi:MAG: hypothetical protein RSA94_00505 [Mucinivorans sp.]
MSINDTYVTRFVNESSTEGLYFAGRALLVRNDNLHQISRRPKGYRIQSDDQLLYVDMMLDKMPTHVGDKCTMSLTIAGLSEVPSGAQPVILRQIKDNKLWLWSEDTQVGLVMPQF